MSSSGASSGNPVSGANGTASQQAASPDYAKPDLEQAFTQVLASRDLNGQEVGPAAAATQATAVVLFASWCSPCRNELAMLGELIQEESRLRVIGVNAYEEYEDRSDEGQLRAFLAESAPWLQVVRADDALMSALGWPTKIPTMFLYDSQGKLVNAFLRAERVPPTKEEMQAALAKVFAQN